MHLPQAVRTALETLRRAGYQGYAVGGCVRDSLLDSPVHDWDLCTDAPPEQTMALFAGCRVIPTGLAHGTVTVWVEEMPLEITTFRVEQGYRDHRHPDAVQFVPSLRQDLARRDLTINAMACGLDGQVVDCFGGQDDLRRGLVRCVGRPDERFDEDALRILRALRFASQLDFVIEENTLQAARAQRALLATVSAERVYAELTRLLCGPGAGRVLAENPDILGVVLPEILPCVGFAQHSQHHRYDVWGHICRTVQGVRPDPLLRWVLLLHDLAKPERLTIDEDGHGHFYGHPQRGAELAGEILRRLRASRDFTQQVTLLVAHHDDMLPQTSRGVRRLLARMEPQAVRQLCEIKRSDMAAHADTARMRQHQRELVRFEQLLEQELARPGCYRVQELALNGHDLLAAGMTPGPAVGTALRYLLEGVLDGAWPNEKEELLRRAAPFLEKAKKRKNEG